jgi:FtsZ-binding cell division protein ZapB
MDLSPVLVWTIAALVAIATPVLGYFSPFGQLRRRMVSELQADVTLLRGQVKELREEVASLTKQVRDCEDSRARLERENYRLYRELDAKP